MGGRGGILITSYLLNAILLRKPPSIQAICWSDSEYSIMEYYAPSVAELIQAP